MSKILDRIKNAPVEQYEKVLAQTRLQYYDRWLERLVEAGKPADPTLFLSDPYIHIEWLLCDFNNLHYVKSKNPKDRAKWYAQLTPEEIAIYDAEYRDIEKQSLKSEVKKALKRNKD